MPVIEIHVAPGDVVNKEDPLVTLESDKATMDIPSPAAGTVRELRVKVGDLVSRGSALLVLDTEGAAVEPPPLTDQQEPAALDAPDPVAAAREPAERSAAEALPAATALPAAAAPGAPETAAPVAADGFEGAHASPGVRRLARELGLDLNGLAGSGPKGRITKDDVIGAVRGPAAASSAAGPAAAQAAGAGIPEVPAQDFSKFGPVEVKPLTRIQRLSGPALHRSWLNVPHVTHDDEADITDLDAYRRELDTAAKAEGYRVTLLAFLMKACVSALREYPKFNSSLTPEKDALVYKGYYHLGVAVDTPEGLVVPVIRDVDRKGVRELEPRARRRLGPGPGGQAGPGRPAGRQLHHLQPGRHRRDRLHAHRQRPRGGDPRRGPVQDGAGLGRGGVRAAADAAALAVLRPPGHRRGAGRPVRPVPVPAARGRPPSRAVTMEADMADQTAEVLVLGAGPGGYTAAFRAADLGKTVVLVDRGAALGGVCLNVGCIPSKALLHAAKVIAETKEMSERGVAFAAPVIDVDQLRSWKESVVHRLTGGLAGLARQRKVVTIRGDGRFISSNQLQVDLADGGTTIVDFEQAIIAAGSQPVTLPFIPHDDPRVIDSTGALQLDGIPQRLLVLGGGIIGLEMATVYHELGAKVTIVELMDQLIPGADKDLVTPLTKRITKRYENIYLATRVTDVEARPEGLVVSFAGAKAPASDTFDKVLVAVGRRPNGGLIGADRAGVAVDERGFVPVDAQMRTNVAHIFAIGDVVGQPMLAHKAMHEGKVAAEVSAGKRSFFDARVIPSVAYTDPEVAWVGITENEAKSAGVSFGKGVFPWAASGRSLSLGRDEGIDQTAVRRDVRPNHRLWHRRTVCRRSGRRGGAGNRDGRRRGRHQLDDPCAPDTVGDGRACG